MEKVLVLLSSYNGEKYIKEQLDSILGQEGVEVSILVRDDGSKDSTPIILEGYRSQGKLDYYLGENIGWRDSFMQLAINSPEYDYYAFSDQDDHWLPQKLFTALNTLKSMEPGPNMYFSNLRYWKNGIDEGLSLPLTLRTDIPHNLLFCHSYGCTMVFNKQLMDIVKTNPSRISVAHDFWFARVAHILGHVYYDKDSHILYRQHDKNQLGAEKHLKERIKKRIVTYSHLFKTHTLDVQTKELLRCYGNFMSKNILYVVSNVAFYRNDFRKYILLLFSSKYTYGNFLTDLGLKFRILVRHI